MYKISKFLRWTMEDALRQISQRNPPEKGAGDADRHTQSWAQHAVAAATPSEQIRAELARLRELVRTKAPIRKRPIRKRTAPIITSAPGKKGPPHLTQERSAFDTFIKRGLPTYLLFECASGYALFHALDFDEIEWNFESTEEYINRFDTVLKLKAFDPFKSVADALYQMNAISNSIVTEQLKSFLMLNLPKPINGAPSYSIAVFDPKLAYNILSETRMPVQSGHVHDNVMRGLRLNIDKFINNFKRGDLEKAQLDLARLYNKQRSISTYKGNSIKASSSSFHEAVVVPHKFEGVFIAMGKEEDAICTKNLVPGEVLYDEELIFVQNEDGTEVEYRLWNPFRSKLAAAILSGVNNIWVKPGSRVLYLGDICGTTVSHLSDLVGPDGLVYAVGLSDGVVNMAEKRSNVIPIFEKFSYPWKYRMLVGIVDVLFASLANSHEASIVSLNATHFLRAGGHYIISTQANYIDSTSQDEALFACLGKREQREFKPIEQVMLKPLERGHAIAVGGFRMLKPNYPYSQHIS